MEIKINSSLVNEEMKEIQSDLEKMFNLLKGKCYL